MILKFLFFFSLNLFFLFANANSTQPLTQHFSAHCSIYNKHGKLHFHFNNFYMCDFHPNGSLVAADPITDTLSYYDHNNQLLWTSRENVHHDIKFSKDYKSILTINSEQIKINKKNVRGDCFIVRSLQNKIEKKWCLSENLKALNELGYDTAATARVRDHNKTPLFMQNEELSHANSFYEIPANARSALHPAFKEGNYIVNLFLPTCALLILDSELKNILWNLNLCPRYTTKNKLSILTHDPQITPNGNLLIYINYITHSILPTEKTTKQLNFYNEKNNFFNNSQHFIFSPLMRWNLEFPFNKLARYFTSLHELDPNSFTDTWTYINRPNKYEFSSDLFGSVTKLENSHYLYTDTTYSNSVIEIDKSGNKLMSVTLKDLPYSLKSAKPFKLYDFFRARKIDYSP